MLLRSIAWISVLFWVNYAQDDYDDDEIIVSENSTDVPEDMSIFSFALTLHN